MKHIINYNNFYISHKSKTCFSHKGEPLSEYNTEEEAQESAKYLFSEGKKMVPYYCVKCNKYHLKPEEFYCKKIKSSCNCKSHLGDIKCTYESKQDAEKMCAIRAQAGIKLFVYKCPSGQGYHLTSKLC